MTNFKTGDRVRYTGQRDRMFGKTGVISENGVYGGHAYVTWDDGTKSNTYPYLHNLELVAPMKPEVGDRVRFKATKRDMVYSGNDLPTEYNGIEGTVTTVTSAGMYELARVSWDLNLIGERGAFQANLEVIERPAPKRKTVVVEFDAPADENIESLVQQITGLTEIKYTIKEG